MFILIAGGQFGKLQKRFDLHVIGHMTIFLILSTHITNIKKSIRIFHPILIDRKHGKSA